METGTLKDGVIMLGICLLVITCVSSVYALITGNTLAEVTVGNYDLLVAGIGTILK